MTVFIGENIRRLRREKQFTQEETAEALGVTFQSVSRWERGESYPDITLLPAIASFFEISVDELLGANKALNEKKIKEYIDLYDNMQLKDSSLIYEKFKLAIKEFPEDFRILIRYMELLQEEVIFNRSTEQVHKGSYKNISVKIKAIYEKIRKNCTDDDIRIRSKRIMITHLMWMYDCEADENGKFIFNKEHLNKAKEIASTLPTISDSRELLTIADKESFSDVTKTALEELIFHLQKEFFVYCFDRSDEERIKKFNALQDLLELIYPDGDYGKNSFHRLYNYGHLGQLYEKTGDNKNAVINLQKAAEYALELDNCPDSEQIKRFYNYGTAYREMSVCEFMKTVMTEHYHLSEEFKETNEFKKIIEALSSGS